MLVAWFHAAAFACSLQLTGPGEGTAHVRPPTFRWSTDCPTARVVIARDGVEVLTSPWLPTSTWSPPPALWERLGAGELTWRVATEASVSPPRAFLRDRDDDNDGMRLLQGRDCDDADPRRFPGALERDNGVDDDCDGAIDEGETHG